MNTGLLSKTLTERWRNHPKLYVWSCLLDHAPGALIAIAISIREARALARQAASESVSADQMWRVDEALKNKPTIVKGMPAAYAWIQ